MKFKKKQVCNDLKKFELFFEVKGGDIIDPSKDDKLVIDSKNIGYCGIVDTVPGCRCD